MSRKYNYFHFTINPKNCDGTNRTIDFLSKELITELDNYLIDLSLEYSRAIESNKDKYGHHYHFVMFAKTGLKKEQLEGHLLEIISHFYLLSADSKKHLLYIKHKTKKQAGLCAGGYLTKQFKDLSEINREDQSKYKTNISDEVIKTNRIEYESLEKDRAVSNFSEWVLNEDKYTPVVYTRITEYYKAIKTILDNDTTIKLNNAEEFPDFYISVLYKYKISFEYNNIRKFHRQILEFIISENNREELEKSDYESIVNLLRFSKSDSYMNIINENQYEQNTILNYWSLN